MFAKQNELNDVRHFQSELPFLDLIIDQACERFCERVIRICDHYLPVVREGQNVARRRTEASLEFFNKQIASPVVVIQAISTSVV